MGVSPRAKGYLQEKAAMLPKNLPFSRLLSLTLSAIFILTACTPGDLSGAAGVPDPTPNLTVTSTCDPSAGTVTFTITNSGGDMPAASSYNAFGTSSASGSFQLLSGASTSVVVATTYIASIDIQPDNISSSTTCGTPPYPILSAV